MKKTNSNAISDQLQVQLSDSSNDEEFVIDLDDLVLFVEAYKDNDEILLAPWEETQKRIEELKAR